MRTWRSVVAGAAGQAERLQGELQHLGEGRDGGRALRGERSARGEVRVVRQDLRAAATCLLKRVCVPLTLQSLQPLRAWGP
jgi:hypothetical protein